MEPAFKQFFERK